MRIHIFTLFPEMFQGPFDHSIVQRAVEDGKVHIQVYDIRDFAHDRHKTTDDYQFGGGAGMVMKPEPIFRAVESVLDTLPQEERAEAPVVLTSPQGRLFSQSMAEELSSRRNLLIICGHYEGVDERVREHLATDEVSIGDYVLTGGELPAMVIVDAVSRLVPGVVGSEESVKSDSITTGLLQHPVYTRPAEFRDWGVPPVLMSGNHGEIEKWRRRQSLERTLRHRPDLLSRVALTAEEVRFLEGLGWRKSEAK
ncbi:MAG: tRNA (guanosine(37)-N1)-methyltransferase TrmD [SAR202 cluster bacterium]|nr:tRNA (guanosine(37)-N1)-methyltransferase TrmD [SAR202 cluster bacterium]